MKYYLAIDIGASGGRHILGHMENGLMVTEEIYRFDNGAVRTEGELLWDTDHIFTEILSGLKACKTAGKIPVSVGIDTWGVDYVLTDADGQKLGKSYCYRDDRTAGADQDVYRIISEEDLYLRTGIQKQIFNTIYQLSALKKQAPQELEKAGAAYIHVSGGGLSPEQQISLGSGDVELNACSYRQILGERFAQLAQFDQRRVGVAGKYSLGRIG